MWDLIEYFVECAIIIGIVICTLVFSANVVKQEQEQREQFYNLIITNEIEFVDNFIETNKTTKFKIVYRENGEIKEQEVNLQQYYEIIEKCKKE